MTTLKPIEKDSMEHVETNEFYAQAIYYVNLNKRLSIERNGVAIGYYLPVHRPDRTVLDRKFAEFEKHLAEFLEKNGLTEDEFADMMDLSRPDPEPLPE